MTDDYAQGGYMPGEGAPIRVKRLGLCGAPLIEVLPGLHIEHIISAKDAGNTERVTEIMGCPGEESHD